MVRIYNLDSDIFTKVSCLLTQRFGTRWPSSGVKIKKNMFCISGYDFQDVSLAANHSLTIEADHYSIVKVGNKSMVNMTTEVLQVLSHDLSNIADIIIPMNLKSFNSTKVKVTFDAKFSGNSGDLDVSNGFEITYEHLSKWNLSLS